MALGLLETYTHGAPQLWLQDDVVYGAPWLLNPGINKLHTEHPSRTGLPPRIYRSMDRKSIQPHLLL